jgi:hypothetical protein
MIKLSTSKIISISILLFSFSIAKAQFYCDFLESKSFYKQSDFIKSNNISKEVIVVQQLKNKEMQDSFKIEITNFNKAGKPVSRFSGSKWNLPVIQDTFDYTGNKLQITSIKDAAVTKSVQANIEAAEKNVYRNDTFAKGTIRYEWDSVKNVKKVFSQYKNAADRLLELIFYDANGRITKIDFAPESERVRQIEYVYKKNKLKIYNVSSTGRECNEEMWFNAMGQLSERKILYFTNHEWVTNKYIFTYYENGLLATETKKKDGQLFTIATHYYY